MPMHRRVVVVARGGPDTIELVDEPIPTPATGEVRIRSLAMGLSGHDAMVRRRGFPGFPKPPFTPGVDVVGVVDAVGDGVDDVDAGDRVAALLGTGSGGHAEMVCVPAERLVPVPDGVDPVDAACLVTDFVTAAAMLRRGAEIQGGGTVLVHGAAGGVGSAIVQLAAMEGIEAYGTASLRKHAFVRSLGAVPIDYRTEDFVERMRELAPDGVDAVFDPIGGSRQLRRSYRTLRRGGRLVWFGVTGMLDHGGRVIIGSLVQRFLLSLRPDGRKAPMPPSADKPLEWYRATLAELLALVADGELEPVVAGRFPLDEVRTANEALDAGDHLGKLVLVGGGVR